MCVCVCGDTSMFQTMRVCFCVCVCVGASMFKTKHVCLCVCVWYLSRKTDSASGVQRQYPFEMMNTSTGLMALRSSRGGGGFDGSQHTYGCVFALSVCVCLFVFELPAAIIY